MCDDEFPFSFSFFFLPPAGASVCRCPVHSEPCRERVVHQPGLRRNCGLAEGPWSPGLSEQSGPAEEPSPATAHRVTALLPTFTMSSSSLLQAPPRSSVPPVAVSVSPFQRADGRMDVGRRRGPALTGLAVSVTLLFWAVGGEVVSGRLFFPSPLLKKKSDLCQKEQQCVDACLSNLSDNLSVCLSLLKAVLSCCSFLGELLPDLRKQQLQHHL